MAYTIKQQLEDFIVEEVLTLNLQEHGEYSYYRLKKINVEQNKALDIIANTFRINKKYINIAGMKDKAAITTQTISIKHGPQKNIKKDDLELTFFGQGDERISLGQLEKNKFIITVRNTDKKPRTITTTPNYFDNQRFGKQKNNHLIGEALVRKDFKCAINLLQQTSSRYTEIINEHLQQTPNDFIGALKLIPRRQLTLYLHAFQSYLFNELLKEEIKKGSSYYIVDYALGELYFPGNEITQQQLPLLGFSTEGFAAIFKCYNLTPRDFIIRSVPGLTEAGNMRDAFVHVEDLQVREIDARTYRVSFALAKGSYATIAIKAMFG